MKNFPGMLCLSVCLGLAGCAGVLAPDFTSGREKACGGIASIALLQNEALRQMKDALGDWEIEKASNLGGLIAETGAQLTGGPAHEEDVEFREAVRALADSYANFSGGALAGSYQYESVEDINVVDGLNAYTQHVNASEIQVLQALIQVESLCP